MTTSKTSLAPREPPFEAILILSVSTFIESAQAVMNFFTLPATFPMLSTGLIKKSSALVFDPLSVESPEDVLVDWLPVDGELGVLS